MLWRLLLSKAQGGLHGIWPVHSMPFWLTLIECARSGSVGISTPGNLSCTVSGGPGPGFVFEHLAAVGSVPADDNDEHVDYVGNELRRVCPRAE